MQTADLLNAYRDYAAKYADWQHSFDLEKILDQPDAPVMSAQAKAGEMIARRGSLAHALAEALAHTLDGSEVSESLRSAYQELISAAIEA